MRHTKPAAMISLSVRHIRLLNGSSCRFMLTTAFGGWSGPLGYTTVTLLSCAVNAKAFPLGEKATSFTHPAVVFKNSPHTVLKGSFSPHAVRDGRSSTCLMKLLKTLA